MDRTPDSPSDRDQPIDTTVASDAVATPPPPTQPRTPPPTPTAAPTDAALAADTGAATAPAPQPAPVTTLQADIATAAPAGAARATAPSLAPDRATMPDDVDRADAVAPATLAPDTSTDVALGDPYVLDTGRPGAGDADTDGLDLPDGPPVADLPTTDIIDTGVDWGDLESTGSIDGRGVDTFEGGSGATGPSDPDAMVSEGGFFDWLFGSTESDTGDAGTDMNGLTTPGVSVDDDGVASTVKEPTGEAAGALSGLADFFMGKKNIDGSATEKQKQMDQIGPDTDGLPPDHPDYAGGPSVRPPGSATDESIEQSIGQGLGGDRGGDVDPFDDPQASPTDGERIYDPYDSVVDPGPDGFAVNPDIDESQLPDATDVVDPYLADG